MANCDECYYFGGIQDMTRVGIFPPNPFGLFDMYGNAYELTLDCWNFSYEGAHADGRPRTDGDCKLRPLRGGGYDSKAIHLESARRTYFNPTRRAGGDIGFRLVRELD